MSKLILPSKKWGNLKTVEKMYKQEKNGTVKVRLNAIRLLMLGESQKEIAKAIGVHVGTIRSWRYRWNNQGKEGLKNNQKGRKSKITHEMRLEIEGIIEIKREINGQIVTGKLIHGFLKKNME